MRKPIFHFILSIFLALAVSDYVWIELVGDNEIVVELESEMEKETEEEVREDKTEGEEDPSKHLGFDAIQYTINHTHLMVLWSPEITIFQPPSRTTPNATYASSS